MRFGRQGKLIPRYIVLFEVLRWVSGVVYELVLPLNLSEVHLAFQISMLKKYVLDGSHQVLYKELNV